MKGHLQDFGMLFVFDIGLSGNIAPEFTSIKKDTFL
jgi:hypothetical protein